MSLGTLPISMLHVAQLIYCGWSPCICFLWFWLTVTPVWTLCCFWLTVTPVWTLCCVQTEVFPGLDWTWSAQLFLVVWFLLHAVFPHRSVHCSSLAVSGSTKHSYVWCTGDVFTFKRFYVSFWHVQQFTHGRKWLNVKGAGFMQMQIVSGFHAAQMFPFSSLKLKIGLSC